VSSQGTFPSAQKAHGPDRPHLRGGGCNEDVETTESPEGQMDMQDDLSFSFALRTGVEFSISEGSDFFERFAFAAYNLWGLAIELLIEALTICQLSGEKVFTVEYVSRAFSTIYSTPPGYTPFDLSDDQEGFDHQKLLVMLENSDD